MWASRKSMTDFGRSTSGPSGWVGSTKPRAASWITSAEQLAEQVGITRGCVTNQLITKCHLSSELFSSPASQVLHPSFLKGTPQFWICLRFYLDMRARLHSADTTQKLEKRIDSLGVPGWTHPIINNDGVLERGYTAFW